MIRQRTWWERIGVAAILLNIPLCAAGSQVDAVSLPAPSPTEGAVRILHFPPDQCMGKLCLVDESKLLLDPKLVHLSSGGSHLLDPAQGDVTVPVDREITLNLLLALDPQDAIRLRSQDRAKYEFVMEFQIRGHPYDLSGLSALDPNDLRTLIVNGWGSRVDSDQRVLTPITHLTGLRMLRLHNTGVTDKGMEQIRALRRLQAVEFSQERFVKNQGLAFLKDLPELEYVDLGTGATDAGLKHLARVPNLRALRIRTGRIWGPGLAELASAPRLERLCLWGEARLTDRQITYLEGLTQLKSLTLWGGDCRLTDASLASIAKLENLEELYFVRMKPRFTPAGLGHLKHLKKLRKVDFAQTWGGEPGDLYGSEIARQLATMSQLESIEGAGNFLPEDIKTLGALPRLKLLQVYLKDRRHGYVSPIGLGHLVGLDSLEELRILTMDTLSEADLTGVEQLRHLKHLGISSHGVTESGVALIGKLRSLEHFDVEPFTRSALNHLNGLSNLRSLNVNGFWGLGRNLAQADEGTLDLSGLTRLRNLTLQSLPLQDDDLAFLDHTPSVEDLMIESTTPLTGTSLRRLGELTELKRLWVNGLSRCTGDDLASLNGLSKLGDLTLMGTIPDAAVGSLDGLPRLHLLGVHTSEPVGQQTVADLRERLRSVDILHVYDLRSVQEPPASPRQRRSGRNTPTTGRRARTNRGRTRR